MCTLVNAIYNPSVLKARARAGAFFCPGAVLALGSARSGAGRARAYVLWGLRSSFELSFDLVAGGVRPTPSLL